MAEMLSPLALLARALAADSRFESLAEVGRITGLTRERVRQLVPAPTGRGKKGPRPRPRIPKEDVHRMRELVALGMGRAESAEMLGYSAHAAFVEGVPASVRPGGRVWGEHGWRSWCAVVEREVGKLIAADALRQGATIREAAEVSGLSTGSISVWISSGELPRSRNRRYYSLRP